VKVISQISVVFSFVTVSRPDNTVDLRDVHVGRDFGQTVEILAGLTPRDRVVANPSDSLLAGTKVRIATAQKPTATK
jgi:hypothetical protein